MEDTKKLLEKIHQNSELLSKFQKRCTELKLEDHYSLLKKITQFKEDEATKVLELLTSTNLNSEVAKKFKICIETQKFSSDVIIEIETLILSELLKPAKEVVEQKGSSNPNTPTIVLSSSPQKENLFLLQRSTSFDKGSASPKKERKSFKEVMSGLNLFGCISERDSNGPEDENDVETKLLTIPEKKAFKFSIFGVEVEDATKEGDACPKIFDFLIDYLVKNKCEEVEGIFRVSGRRNLIESLQMDLDQGLELDFTKYQDIHNFSCVLKQYFRELPTPLLTFNLYNEFVKSSLIDDDTKKLEEMCRLLKTLSKPRLYILGKLLGLLQKISKNQQLSFMTTNNLSVVFGVTLLRAQTTDPQEEMKNQHLVTKVVEVLIENYDQIKDLFDVVTIQNEETKEIFIENKDQETKIEILKKE